MLLNFFLIPLYLQVLGVEAFGLIGVFGVLMAVFCLLDMGLGATLNREMARLSARADSAQEQRDLVRTLEVVYWGISLGVALVIWWGAPLIAAHWLNAGELSTETVVQAVQWMGLVVALQLCQGFYQGGLMGLQQQVPANVILMVVGTLRFGGVLPVLWWVSSSIQAFFIWQALISGLAAGWFWGVLWRRLPQGEGRAEFKPVLAWHRRGFALPMVGNAVIGVFITQMDKIILSKMVPLKVLGFYTLANTLASFVGMVVTPLNSALLPRFAHLWEAHGESALTDLYHTSCQLMTVMVLPLGMVLIFFSHEVLMLWTGSPEVAAQASLVTSLLVLASCLNTLINIPVQMQIAAGWPQLMMYTNMSCMFLSIPAMVVMVQAHGSVGAAWVSVGINVFYIAVNIPLMHRRLLRGEMRKFFWKDEIRPWLGILSVVGLARWWMPANLPWLSTLISLGALWILASLVGVGLAQRLRHRVLSQIKWVWS